MTERPCEESPATEFVEAAVALQEQFPKKENVSLSKTRFVLRYN
jgi:hypothetical protein